MLSSPLTVFAFKMTSSISIFPSFGPVCGCSVSVKEANTAATVGSKMIHLMKLVYDLNLTVFDLLFRCFFKSCDFSTTFTGSLFSARTLADANKFFVIT